MADIKSPALFGRDGLINAAIVVAVVLLLSFLYPGGVHFSLDYQKGQAWRHESLVAEFDFAIQKSQEEIQEDRRQISARFSPCYRMNPELADAKIKDLYAALKQQAGLADPADTLPGESQLAFLRAEQWIRQIYTRGIIELQGEHQNQEAEFVVNLLLGNVIAKRTLPGFFQLDQAQTALADSLAKYRDDYPQNWQKLIQEALAENIFYDVRQSEKLRQQAQESITTTRGVIRQGEVIVKKGDIISDEIYARLNSYRDKYEHSIASAKSSFVVYAGYVLLTSLIIGAFMMYLNAYRREILSNRSYLLFVMLWLLLFSYLAYLAKSREMISIYAIPYCIVPIVVRHFFTYRLAFFTHVVVILIAGLINREGYQFIFAQVAAGVVAVLTVADARDWTKFFRSVLFIFITYALAILGLGMVRSGEFAQVDWSVFGWLLLNGVLTLMSFPLIPLMERLFGFTSSISLVELADMNRPLLRQLAMNAPGTLQHSLQVGNLAEAVAVEIGANPLLVRTGALYHDIGKMINPDYFVENQSGRNPHEGLSPLESAALIMAHVKNGEQLARQYKLPRVITRFISSHHGTSQTAYFYKIYLRNHPDEAVDPQLFTYPGPKPQTKCETIVMLADSLEASARSLKDPTGKDIDELVDRVFEGKIASGQLEESRFTFADLEKARSIFKKMLRSIHHVRIEYPE
ncbi:MAG: hypothetical protein RI973_517 [Bacteroidota bacterium]|jgi:putative nucleotidyltransferase with HDIG domain